MATTDRTFRSVAGQTWKGAFFRRFVFMYIMPIIFSIPFIARRIFYQVSQCAVAYPTSPMSKGKIGAVTAGMRLPWVRFADESDNQEPLGQPSWQLHVYGTVPSLVEKTLPEDIRVREFPWCNEAKAVGLKENVLYLLRPDGHVGLVTTEASDLPGYIQRWTTFSVS